MCVLKRVLPFLLTACVGLLVGNFALTIKPNANAGHSLASRVEQRSYSFYSEQCRCMTWTSERKYWVDIKNLPKPDFTAEARRHRFTGGTEVRVLLGADGKVSKIEPYGLLPYGLNDKIRSAASGIEFTPAAVFVESPESVWVTIDYQFKTVNNGFHDTYEVEVIVFDHFDVNRNGLDIRLERADF